MLTIWWVKYTLLGNMVSQITLLGFNLIKPISLILKPCFMIYICPFLMILVLSVFMINVTSLILKLSITDFYMVNSFSTSYGAYISQFIQFAKHPAMLQTTHRLQ